MAASIFEEKSIEPTEELLTNVLRKTKPKLDRIYEFIEDEYGHINPEWKHYGQKTGWLLKLFHKKRNVTFVVPLDGSFRCSFVFGDKAVELIMGTDIPDGIKSDLENARKYAEGRGVNVEVKEETDLEGVLKLIRVKLDT